MGTLLGIVIDILIGALVGWIAGILMKSKGGFVRNAIMGIIGGFVAGLLLPGWLGYVGAVIGAGLTRGVKNVNFGVFKRIAVAWVSSPTVAGLLAYLVAFLTRGYFA